MRFRPPEVVAFDGDDTLWHSEIHFQAIQARLRRIAGPWLGTDELDERLLATERANLTRYGYGVKSFALSAMEVLLDATDGDLPGTVVAEVIQLAKELLNHPVDLLDGVIDALDVLDGRFRLVLITKGDLHHQWYKIETSGLGPRFERVEVVHEKDPATYSRVIETLGIEPDRFLMVGNSARSDVLPVLEVGGEAFQVTYEVTWPHEAHRGEETWPVFESLGAVAEHLLGQDPLR